MHGDIDNTVPFISVKSVAFCTVQSKPPTAAATGAGGVAVLAETIDIRIKAHASIPALILKRQKPDAMR